MAGYSEEIKHLLKEGKLAWGNLADLSETAIAALGLEGAKAEAHRSSPRRASSGMTNAMTRAERKAHYTRKAVLEREKEGKRRANWVRNYPGAKEEHWEKKEAVRRTRKQQERDARKAAKNRNRGTTPPIPMYEGRSSSSTKKAGRK